MQEIKEILENTYVQVALTIAVAYLAQKIIKIPLGRLIDRVVRQQEGSSPNEEKQREDTLKSAIGNVLNVTIWIAAVIVILAQLDVNIAALATGAGAAGLVIGIGAQGVIKDWLAGLFIIANNEYRVGDIAQLNVGGIDYFGTVEEITIRLTKMRMLDGSLCIINNGTINVVNNHSFKYGNILVDVIVNYDTDLDKVEKIMNETGLKVAGDDKWKQYIKRPIQFYRVDGFNESSVTVKAMGEVYGSGMQWMIAGAFRQSLHRAFKDHKITVPHKNIIVENSDGTSKKSKTN